MSRSPSPGRERPRLLQVVLSVQPGGAERLVIEISKRLAATVDVRVCCLDAPGEWAGELIERGIPVEALRRRPGFRPSLAFRLARLARRERIGVIHCHQYSPFVYCSLASLLLPGLRLVYTEHGRLSDAPLPGRRRIVHRLLGRVPDHVVAVCADLGDELAAAGLPGDRLRVVYNGVAANRPPTAAERAEARADLGLPGTGLVVGTVARLDSAKNLELLIASFASLPGSLGPAYLVIVGDGPERARLEAAARRHGLGDRVRFTGRRDDARRLLGAFDLYANSSITEAHSVTILEAMAAALPVVATRVGGNPELVAHGETGLLVPARDGSALTAALRDLGLDPELRRTLGKAGRARLESDFTLDRMVRSYVELYGVD